jgi:TonB dependent receptor
LGFDIDYSHLISQKVCHTSDPTTCVDIGGTHGPTGISGATGTPRNRAQATLDYGIWPAEAGVTLNYVSGYTDVDPTLGPSCLDLWYTRCYTSSFTDFDLFAHYQLTKQLLINAHVLKLFNMAAPVDPQAAYNQSNYNMAFAQQGAIGRFIAGVHGVGYSQSVPANVTVLYEGDSRIYSTRGDDKCTIDELSRTPLGTSPAAHALRVSGRGFCVAPAAAIDGGEGLLLSRFDFAGVVIDDESAAEAGALSSAR